MVAPVSWQMNGARSLTIELPVPGMRDRGPGPHLHWPCKDPADVLDYQFDISPVLSEGDGDAISAVSATIVPNEVGGLSVVSTSSSGALAVLWLSGGLAGTRYRVTLHLVTQLGRVLARDVGLAVEYLATPTTVPNALLVDSGEPLLDQAGEPITV